MAQHPTPEQLRMYCDSELPEDVASQVEAFLDAHPENRASVAFEYALRQRIARTLSESAHATPSELKDRVRAALIAADVAQSAEPTTDDAGWSQPTVAGRIDAETRTGSSTGAITGAASGATNESETAAPSRASIYAIAAVLALMGMVVALSMLAPNIDQLNPPSQVLVNDDLLTAASAYAANEHMRCTLNDAARSQKLAAATPEAARSLMGEIFAGQMPQLPNLDSLDYAFSGAGVCGGMPGHESAIHVVYGKQMPDGREARVSIFIEPEDGQIAATLKQRGLTWSPCNPVPIGKNARCSRQVYLLGDGGFAYFVVCCRNDELEDVVDEVRGQLATIVGR